MDTAFSRSFFLVEVNSVLTKVDLVGKLNIFHKYNLLLPLRTEGYWDVHNELEGLQKQGEINIGKFVVHDQELVRVGGIATGAAAGKGAFATYLGPSSILSMLSSGGTLPAPIEVHAISMNISYIRNDLNRSSSSSTLAITNLNNNNTISI